MQKKTNRSNLAGNEVPTQIKNQDLVQQRRRQIIDSTVKLFIDHGYHKTTTRMIAKAANFSIGSLYEYVSSKEDLLYLVCKTIHEEVQDSVLGKPFDAQEPKNRLAEIIRRYFNVCDKMADHILLMYQVTQFLPEKWKKQVLENELSITRIFMDTLSSLSGKDDFPKLDPKIVTLAAHNIAVLGQMWAFRRWQIQQDFTIDEYIKIQSDFILGLIF